MLHICRYIMDVKLSFPPDHYPASAPGTLLVQARLMVENGSADSASSLPLLFYRLHTVSGVAVNGQAVAFESRLTGLQGLERHHVNAVTVALPEPLAPGAACTVDLTYGGVTAGAREVWPYIWDAVTREYTLLRPDMLWYPELATPDRQSLGQSVVSVKEFDVTVLVPEGYVAAGPELVSAEPGLARFVTSPRWRFDLAIAPFARLESGGVSIYHLPGSKVWGRETLGWANAALQGLGSRLGPRGTGGLWLVQIPHGWGSQASPGFILQQAGKPGNWQAAAEVVHEVSHFWTPAPADRPRRFADEALAMYFQYVLVGDLFGPAVAREQLSQFQRAVAQTPGAPEARFLDEEIGAGLHSAVWYCKGALALHALCGVLGEERFWALLREYTRESTATTAGFAGLVRRLYPGAETESYLREWFG